MTKSPTRRETADEERDNGRDDIAPWCRGRCREGPSAEPGVGPVAGVGGRQANRDPHRTGRSMRRMKSGRACFHARLLMPATSSADAARRTRPGGDARDHGGRGRAGGRDRILKAYAPRPGDGPRGAVRPEDEEDAGSPAEKAWRPGSATPGSARSRGRARHYVQTGIAG